MNLGGGDCSEPRHAIALQPGQQSKTPSQKKKNVSSTYMELHFQGANLCVKQHTNINPHELRHDYPCLLVGKQALSSSVFVQDGKASKLRPSS